MLPAGAPQNSVESVIENVNKAIRQGERAVRQGEFQAKKDLGDFKKARKRLENYANTGFRELMASTKTDLVAKGTTAAGDLATAIHKFQKGDTQSVVSGCLDLLNGMSNFLPPPASIMTGTLVGVANIFLGGKSPRFFF